MVEVQFVDAVKEKERVEGEGREKPMTLRKVDCKV